MICCHWWIGSPVEIEKGLEQWFGTSNISISHSRQHQYPATSTQPPSLYLSLPHPLPLLCPLCPLTPDLSPSSIPLPQRGRGGMGREHPLLPLLDVSWREELQGLEPAYVSIRQHTSAYVSTRQHTSAHVSMRHGAKKCEALSLAPAFASVFVLLDQ